MLARAAPLALTLAACGACKDPPKTSATDAAAGTATARPSAATASTPTHEPAPPPALASDAGPSGCKLLEGPVQLARPGPYAARSRLGFVDFFAKDAGRPVLAGSMRVAPRPGAPTLPAPPVAPATARGERPPCAAAGMFAFCMNASGELRRYRLGAAGAESDNFVARARPGTPVAAALVDGSAAGGTSPTSTRGHPVVAYLRDRTTTEGRVTEAYVEGEDGTELHLSEDGAGATTVALAPRGTGAVAVYVDARRGMSPVHARTIASSPKLTLGKDAVLFIAGGAEPGTRVALGVRGPSAYALLPVAHDLAFGLAVVRIEGEPRTDAPVVWSDYPNGLDPAPVAATVDGPSAFVARVRPSAPKFGSPHVLEIGTLDATGAFASLGLVPTRGTPVDVAVAADGEDAFVLAYTDAAGGWAERLSCGSPK